MVKLASPVQRQKAPWPILATPSGMVRLVRPLQREKAPSSIFLTPAGSVIRVRPLQQAKALLESYGLVAVNGGEEESEEAVGKVSRWSSSGKSVKKGTKITVWISGGIREPEPEPEPKPEPEPEPGTSGDGTQTNQPTTTVQ